MATQSTAMLERIEEKLHQIPADQLPAVYDFIAALANRHGLTEAMQTMLASEPVLRREWDTPEEDAAWTHL